jgi:hypothetical protein
MKCIQKVITREEPQPREAPRGFLKRKLPQAYFLFEDHPDNQYVYMFFRSQMKAEIGTLSLGKCHMYWTCLQWPALLANQFNLALRKSEEFSVSIDLKEIQEVSILG